MTPDPGASTAQQSACPTATWSKTSCAGRSISRAPFRSGMALEIPLTTTEAQQGFDSASLCSASVVHSRGRTARWRSRSYSTRITTRAAWRSCVRVGDEQFERSADVVSAKDDAGS